MGLFNFNFKSNDSTSSDNQPVILQLNEEQVQIPADEAKGKTVEQLFDQYADDLGDTTRINRYVNAGRVVPGDTVVQSGTVYRAAITSEGKG